MRFRSLRLLTVFSPLLVSVCVVHAASLLTPLSAIDYQPLSERSAIGVDTSGRVMIVYIAKNAEGQWGLYSLLKTGSSWSQTNVPLPALPSGAHNFTLRDLAARGPEAGFHLLATYTGGRIYYWKWQGGHWAQPELVTDDGSESATLALDANNQPLVARSSTRFRIYRQVGQEWQKTQLDTVTTQMTHPWALAAVYVGPGGIPRLFGTFRQVPLVASLVPQGNLAEPGDWQVIPTSDRADWVSVVPRSTSRARWALDWPHQLVYVAWREKDTAINVAWAPVGTTSLAPWQTRRLEVPPETKLFSDGLQVVSNGCGAVGLVYACWRKGGDPSLYFHWLSSAGPGPQVELIRPGTQTEASMFSSMSSDSVTLSIDRQGTAHITVQAVKRGEIPANTRRLFYTTVTGGPTSTDDPDSPGAGAGSGATGGGTTETGPKPDFLVTVEPMGIDLEGDMPRLNLVNEQSLSLRLKITNQGAQYFGDLSFRAEVDGAVVKVTLPDESGHRYPLFERGQTKTISLPKFRYESTLAEEAPAPITYNYPKSSLSLVRLHTGLGRKHLTVTLDPDNTIAEADEENNRAEMNYLVYDGREKGDRVLEGRRTVKYGLNDLGFLLAPRLLSNTKLLHSGYVQRPTELQALVGNPEFAGVFSGVEIALFMDGEEIARQTIAELDRKPNLVLSLQGDMRYYGPALKPDASGAMLRFPVDLTNVAEGNHMIKVVIDPEDKFADLRRDNNEAQMTFRVRPPGGTVRVRVTDFTQPTRPVARALLVFEDMWFGWTDAQGAAEIPDVPAATYSNRSLSGEREHPAPRYYQGYAEAFTVANRQTQDVTMKLERAITLVGDVKVAGTGALLTDEPCVVSVQDGDSHLAARVSGGHYRIEDVPPGQHTIVAAAYGYQTLTTTTTAARPDAQSDECRLDLTLTDGPRATITGIVQARISATSVKPLAGALVWLAGAPRAAETDAQGRYTLERVAAGRADTVVAAARSHTDASTRLTAPATGATLTAPDLVLARIDQKLKTIDFDATTWAICEETAEAGSMPSIQVNTKFGAFTGALGLMYHATAGQPQIHADYLLLCFQGGTFIQGGVSSEIGIDKLTGVSLDTLKVGPMKDVIEAYGKVFSVIEGINKLADWMYGDLDPSMMHRNNKVVGTYTTHTGADYEQDPLIDIPTSTDIPVAVTFAGGGQTIIRVDHIILKDATGQKKRIVAEWYSPGFAVYKLDAPVLLESAEIQLEMAVLNERLQSGVLGTASRNLVQWKPNDNNWLRFSAYNYSNF